MRAMHNKHNVRAAGAARRGFTLIELMMVMFILSVLVALVVGVSWYVIEQGRKIETLSSQRRLMGAIEAYRKATNKLPYRYRAGDVEYNPESNYTPEAQMTKLLDVLRGKTPRNAVATEATKAMLGETGGSLTSDAYGKAMIYLSDKGVGGNPVIISAGPDEMFGLEKGSYTTQQREQYKKDNVRSDVSN